MKFCKNRKENENAPAQNAKNVICAGVKISKIFLNFTLAQNAKNTVCAGVFSFSFLFLKNLRLIVRVEER